MRKIILFLLFFNVAYAQNNQDFVNSFIVPSIVLLVFTYGGLNFIRIPKIPALVMSIALIIFAYFIGFLNAFSSFVLKLGSLTSTGIYISLFLLGSMLASRTGFSSKKVKFADVRKMNRKQISQEMSNIEKRLVEMQNKLEKLKIQEHNLELQFANNKSNELLKELERVRRLKNELSDTLDMLIERREAFKRAYRESTV